MTRVVEDNINIIFLCKKNLYYKNKFYKKKTYIIKINFMEKKLIL